MSTATSPSAASVSNRIVSIDVFRGLTMLLMLFSNDIGDADLGCIQNAPWWMKHMPSQVDGMTASDVIWPCFMLILGLSIPIAFEKRIARGDSLLKLGGHILLRSTALIFIGLCMVNGSNNMSLDAAAMGISAPMWRLLMFLGVILLWNAYPSPQDWKKWLFTMLRVAGAALLIYLLVIYRATENGQSHWFRTRWWGVLGLIGWAYFFAALVWLACRDQGAAVMGAMGLLLAINMAAQHGPLDEWWAALVPGYMPSIKELTWLTAMAVAGMAVAMLFRPHAPSKTPRSRIAWMLVFAAGYASAGFLLRPLWGIHKSGGTPAWILLSLSIACTLYAFFYWLVDMRQIKRWTVLIAPAGSNTLLMYLLPHIFYALLALAGVTYLQTHFHEGWIGVARSAVLAVFFVALTGLLTRCRIRLHL